MQARDKSETLREKVNAINSVSDIRTKITIRKQQITIDI